LTEPDTDDYSFDEARRAQNLARARHHLDEKKGALRTAIKDAFVAKHSLLSEELLMRIDRGEKGGKVDRLRAELRMLEDRVKFPDGTVDRLLNPGWFASLIGYP
jgi:hypothetical protein